ncbi:MAG: response regulator transcription factor [Burkholderiales bacterium]|nr:response regulator transcription factor [Burkholderiales bacterium]
MNPAPTALLAEDEPLLARALQADLERLWPELRVLATVGDGATAVEQALARRPSLCFFDIRMPGLSGLEAAQALAEEWPEGVAFPLLVFVTAYDQYALQAFEAQAVDYLVKPVQAPRLASCVQRLKKRLAAAPEGIEQTLAQLRALLGATPAATAATAAGAAAAAVPRLQVIQASAGALVHMVPVDEVLYFEAADKYLRVVTAEREHLIRLSLRELLPQIDPQQFWQVHRSLVVRAGAIATALRDESGKVFLTLRGRPERLTASRLYAHLFKGM